MATQRQIRESIKNPTRSVEYIYNKLYSLPKEVQYEYFRRKKKIPKQKKLIDKFTKNKKFGAIILDACRYDLFKEVIGNYLEGDLQLVWGSGRWTGEYTVQTWNDYHQLVYFSSIPVVSDRHFERMGSFYRPSEQFDKLVPLWDSDWDGSRGTVPADQVTNSVLKYASQTTDPRFVAHYAQPHVPYIGETEILPWEKQNNENVQDLMDSGDTATTTFYEMVEKNKLSDDTLQQAYEDNLKYVLEEVKRLIHRIDCPIVITADHGEHLGENGEYFHKNDSTLLRQVPWFVVDNTEIGITEIEEEYNSTFEYEKSSVSTDEIEERLTNLGYK